MNDLAEAKKYFWDVNPETLDTTEDASFIIGRILEYGDIKAARWLIRAYPEEKITEIVKTMRVLSAKSARFWQEYFHIKEDEMLCLQQSSLPRHMTLWPPSVPANS